MPKTLMSKVEVKNRSCANCLLLLELLVTTILTQRQRSINLSMEPSNARLDVRQTWPESIQLESGLHYSTNFIFFR